MENLTYRTNFLDDVTVDDVIQKDLGSLDFGDFDFGQTLFYKTDEYDIGRPDIISYKIYGTTNYQWFLMEFNGISDCWNDIRENMLIEYPSIDMVREGLKYARKKEKD